MIALLRGFLRSLRTPVFVWSFLAHLHPRDGCRIKHLSATDAEDRQGHAHGASRFLATRWHFTRRCLLSTPKLRFVPLHDTHHHPEPSGSHRCASCKELTRSQWKPICQVIVPPFIHPRPVYGYPHAWLTRTVVVKAQCSHGRGGV